MEYVTIHEGMEEDIAKILKKGESASTVDQLNELAWSSRRGELNKSYKIAHIAEEISARINYKKGISQALKCQGYCLWRYSDYHSSMEKSSAAMEIAQTLNDPKEEADILNNIGAVYMFLNDNENRLKCNLKCLELRRKVDFHEGIAGSLNNIGETYMEMNEYDKAIEYFDECLDYPHSSSQVKGWVYHNRGIIESRRKNFEDARKFFQTSIELSDGAGDETLTCETLYNMALNYGDLNQDDAMEATLDRALALATRINAKDELQKIHLAYSKLYERQGDIVKAFRHFNQHTEIHRQVYNEKNASIVHNLKSKYELNALRKEAEIERLKNVELKKAFKEIERHKDIIEQKNQSIQDSIRYARKIQKALLSMDSEWHSISSKHFVLFRPRDIVSGDFFWAFKSKEADENCSIWAVADCTGHGVPGAFMSMLGVGLLNEIIVEGKNRQTHLILEQLRSKIKRSLEHKGKESDAKLQRQDGMDIALCILDHDTNKLMYSGAFNALFIVSGRADIGADLVMGTDESGTIYLHVLKANKQPVGSYINREQPFVSKEVQLEPGDRVYAFSDGYIDQFGGERGQKFMRRRFVDELLSIQHLDIKNQKEHLNNVFEAWMEQGNCSQIDDVCVVGLEIE